MSVTHDFIVAMVAIVLRGCLCVLSLGDIVHARGERLGGPIQFMTLDNFRHYACLLVIGILIYSDYDKAVFYIIIGDVLFGFHRRRHMAQLVGEYLNLTMPGGKRWSDRCRDGCMGPRDTNG